MQTKYISGYPKNQKYFYYHFRQKLEKETILINKSQKLKQKIKSSQKLPNQAKVIYKKGTCKTLQTTVSWCRKL